MSNRKTAAAIAMLLALTFTISIIALPTANAQTTFRTKKTYAVVGAMPNPVGVGQSVLIWIGITDYLALYHHGWDGLTVTVTRPDNTTQTLGPFRTDSTGSTGTEYTPNMVGTYYLQTHFPAQWYNWTTAPAFSTNVFGSIWYEASSSEKYPLIVQQEQVKPYPGSPLPSEYWTRPIDAQHREWSKISANWVTTPPNWYAPYNDDAPETPHILWAKPYGHMGGLAGGERGDNAFECGDAYEGFFSASVILGGNLYYNRYKPDGATRVEQEVVAVNLHTGEELWRRTLLNNSRLAFGQAFYWDSWNYHGVFPYLWVTSTMGTGAAAYTVWSAFDAQTGRWLYNITNVPSGTTVYGPKGEIYIYTINSAAGWMTLWNSSRTVQPQTTNTQADGSWIRANTGTVFNATRGYDWNRTIPRGLPGTVRHAFFENRIVGSDAAGWMTMGDLPVAIWCISVKPGQEGQLLYNKTWQPPRGDLTVTWGSADIESGIFTIRAKDTRKWWGFSLDTGEPVWGPTEAQDQLGVFGMSSLIAYGKFFSWGYGGTLYCYDVKTGKLLWIYDAKDPYNEILWANNWAMRILFVTDGKIYMGHDEHSPVDPKPRGAPTFCIDIETGKVVWRIDGAFRQTSWGGRAIIGDSIIATMNSYDQRIYAIGKGPSATTVSAPNTGVQLGASVVISGMVTDISPGTNDLALKMRFPNGVPAVADEYMGEWMKYVYMQFERPKNVQGVPVTIDVLDANGNYRNIGTAVSDADGFFSFAWTPDIEGKYTVVAGFAGSKSYYPSRALAAFMVDPAPPAPAQPEPAPPNMTDTYVVYAAIAIIAAIAIFGVLTLLAVRKRS